METHFPEMEPSNSRIARERVLADMRALARDAESLLKATADDVSEKAKDARIRVSAALDRAKTTYADLQEHGIESARAAVKQADETIRSHPYESVGVAFGIGILIGAILRRR